MKLGNFAFVAAVFLAVAAGTVHGSKQKRASLFCEDSNWVASSVGKVYACYRNRDDDDHCKSYKTSASSSAYDRSRYDEFDDVTTYFIDCADGKWDDVPGICRRRSGAWIVSARCDTNDEEAIIPVVTDEYSRRQRRKRRRASDRKQQRELLRHGGGEGGGETKEAMEDETGIVTLLEENEEEQDRNLKMEFDRTSRASRTSVRIDGRRWIILDYDGDDDDSDECDSDECDDDDDEDDEDDGTCISSFLNF